MTRVRLEPLVDRCCLTRELLRRSVPRVSSTTPRGALDGGVGATSSPCRPGHARLPRLRDAGADDVSRDGSSRPRHALGRGAPRHRDAADERRAHRLRRWHHGRLYLPEELLKEAGVSNLHVRLGGPFPLEAVGAVSAATEELLLRADAYYRSGDSATRDSRRAARSRSGQRGTFTRASERTFALRAAARSPHAQRSRGATR